MDNDNDFEKDIERTKKRAKWGCLTWAVILLFGPIIIFIGVFSFEMSFKEKILVISHSPSETNTIEIVEKGVPAFFGPSSIRIKYGWKHIDRSVGNDGKTLQESNVSVHWENDEEAIITIYGEEQSPEVIKFNAKEFPTSELGESESELGSFTFKTSESPNLTNIIEFREVSTAVQIFYGERGSVLEKYKEYIPSDIYTPDNFKVDWKNEEEVKIEVIRENDKGETYIEDTIKIILSE